MNRGTVGFLLNNFNENNLLERYKPLKNLNLTQFQ